MRKDSFSFSFLLFYVLNVSSVRLSARRFSLSLRGVQKHIDLLVFKDDWDKQGDCDTYTHAHHSHILMQRYLLRQEGACGALSSSNSSTSDDAVKRGSSSPPAAGCW